jgi:hypothetical protein
MHGRGIRPDSLYSIGQIDRNFLSLNKAVFCGFFIKRRDFFKDVWAYPHFVS